MKSLVTEKDAKGNFLTASSRGDNYLFQMSIMIRKYTFQARKKMGQSLLMPFQAGEKIRAGSGLEVPSHTTEKDGKDNFLPTSSMGDHDIFQVSTMIRKHPF